MKKFYLALFTVLYLTLVNFAQDSKPAQTPIPAGDDQDVVKISTTLIQVDAVVVDEKGNIVRDLKPEDFEIYENGKKQNLTNFSFISTVSETAPDAKPAPAPKRNVSDPVPPVQIRPEQVRRTIALVVDDLGLSFESIYYVRRSLKKFVDEQMQPNDLVAIIRTGGGMGALQQFTADKRQLYAAIEKIKWNSQGRAGISAFSTIEATPLEQAKANGLQVSDQQLEDERKANIEREQFREDIFSVGTLGAINFIVKGMGELPGRKSVMLFSDGFKICSLRNADNCGKFQDSLRKLTDLANRAAVTIYSMDARGLQTLSLAASDNTNSQTQEQVSQKLDDRRSDLIENQDGLSFLSRQTGGRAFFNNNDMNWALDKALQDQNGYYLLGYQPDEDTFDPKIARFNKLDVKVLRKGLKVRYRSGFFGIADTETKNAAKLTPVQQIQKALVSPFSASGINVRLNTVFGSETKLGSAGAFVNSFLHVEGKDLNFTDEPDGFKKVSFDILAVSFNESGIPVDQVGKTYEIRVKGDVYEKMITKGFVYQFLFPVKKPGPYQMRVAIRDKVSEKVGSANLFIEVPNLKKERLTLSGIILENLTEDDLKKAQKGEQINTDPMSDTSLRRFKGNTALRYMTEIYNAKLAPGGKPQLETQLRLFKDGKVILEGDKKPLDLTGQKDMQKLNYSSAIWLAKTLAPGDYILQVVITDTLAKEKYKTSTQWVQFEITE